jgi:hypothetical protein
MREIPINDYESIAHKSGLKSDQVEHFISGLRGETEKVLAGLDRSVYTQLQGGLEGLELPHLQGSDTNHFRYLTRRPLTPLLNPDHPRSKVADAIFSVDKADSERSGPFGISVFSQNALREMAEKNDFTSLTGPRLLAFLQRFSPQNCPFSLYSDIIKASAPEAVKVDFMASPAVAGVRSSVAFHAPQEGAPNGSGSGEVYFGALPQKLASLVLLKHRINKKEKRGWGLIGRYLQAR